MSPIFTRGFSFGPGAKYTMSKPSIFILDTYHPHAVAHLQSLQDFDVVLPDDPRLSSWRDQADGVLVRSNTYVTASDFEKVKKLKVVVKQGVGVDNIDLDGARKANVAVHNTPALNSETVAEFALALTLSIARRIPELDRQIREGEKLVRSKMLGLSLYGKTVGVIGMGNIGRIVARKFVGACDAQLIAYDPVAPPDVWADLPHTRAKTVDEVLKVADVITIHVPLLDSTRGMIGKPQLEMMKSDAILVNTARGGVVSEPALLEVLKRGHLWGAVLDAVEVEPPTKKDYPGLLSLDNVIITPHVGAGTRENQSNSGLAAVRTLLGVLAGDADVPGKVV